MQKVVSIGVKELHRAPMKDGKLHQRCDFPS